MIEKISPFLIIYVNTSFLIYVVIHIIVCRIVGRSTGFQSPQIFLLKFNIIMNVPFIVGIIIFTYSGLLKIMNIPVFIYSIFIFNGLSHVYLCVFNMTESSRRFLILNKIYKSGTIHIDELHNEYSPVKMITTRLDRLKRMGEITQDNHGRYRISSRIFITIARIFALIKNILGFSPYD